MRDPGTQDYEEAVLESEPSSLYSEATEFAATLGSPASNEGTTLPDLSPSPLGPLRQSLQECLARLTLLPAVLLLRGLCGRREGELTTWSRMCQAGGWRVASGSPDWLMFGVCHL